MSKPHTLVLGAGISGLTAAFHLVRQGHRVTILEQAGRCGGWIKTVKVPRQKNRKNEANEKHEGDGHVVFELGPRSLRPSRMGGGVAAGVLELISSLKLTPSLLLIPKSHPAATSRYIFHNNSLQKLPSSLLSLISHPDLASSIIRERFIRRTNLEDESIHDLVLRRFGPACVPLVDAGVRGIWGGDARDLSARSGFRSVWKAEREWGSVIKGMMKKKEETGWWKGNEEIESLAEQMKGTSLYSFTEGMETLVHGLETDLKSRGVDVCLNTTVTKIDPSTSLTVTTSTGKTFTADNIISSLPLPTLSTLIPLPTPPIKQCSITTVSLGYTHPVIPPHLEGFGYLIPSSSSSSVLGVVFDSVPFPSQSPGLTRMTVMMRPCESALPLALETVESHMGISDVPEYTYVATHENCIPQYHVGYHKDMCRLHDAVKKVPGLAVTGASVSFGVGVNDVVEHARAVARGVGKVTGLEGWRDV